MKVSVITCVLNNGDMLTTALDSLFSQTYVNFEFIVIDGGSHDETLHIIEQNRERINILISEPDNGLYDALNKGISYATGDIVGFLHADDLYENPQVLEKVVAAFKQHQVDSVYGDLMYVQANAIDKVIRYWRSGEFRSYKLWRGWMPPHPTFFVKRNIYEQFGVFNTHFKIAADYDLVLRFLGKHLISTYYLPEVLIKMRWGGKSNKNLKNILIKSKEDLQALRDNGIGGKRSLFLKNASKIPQFFMARFKPF